MVLLLKLCLLIGIELVFYDILFVILGVVVDISYIVIFVKVIGYVGEENLVVVLKDVYMVFVIVGVVCKFGMICVDLFNINGNIIKNLVEKVVEVCFDVCVGIVSNFVNILVLLVVEVLCKKGVYDKCKLFGVFILDVVCVKSFVFELKEKYVEIVKVFVIGGYFGLIILLLFF